MDIRLLHHESTYPALVLNVLSISMAASCRVPEGQCHAQWSLQIAGVLWSVLLGDDLHRIHL